MRRASSSIQPASAGLHAAGTTQELTVSPLKRAEEEERGGAAFGYQP
jgi:hypothetical protein